jgi:antitoxin CcdA
VVLDFYNIDAPKKPTNLTINSDLLNQAKSLNINISSVLETALAEKVRQKLRSEWLEENSDAILSYNNHIGSIGVFSDDFREF